MSEMYHRSSSACAEAQGGEKGRLKTEQIRSFFSESPHGFLLTSPKGEPLYWNRRLHSLLGIPESLHGGRALSSQESLSYFSLRKNIKNLEHFELHLQQVYSKQRDVDLLLELRTGQVLEICIYWRNVPQYEGSACFWSVRDVSAKSQEKKYLRKLKDRYEMALHSTQDGIWDWDLKNNVLYLDPRWRKLLALDRQSSNHILENHFTDLLQYTSLEERLLITDTLRRHIQSSASSFQIEVPVQDDKIGFMWLRLQAVILRKENGAAYRIAGSIKNVTNKRLAEVCKTVNQRYDRLTGLPNRLFLVEKLRDMEEQRAGSREELRFAILVLSLNRFRIINESFGPHYGDRVMREASQRLKNIIRAEDTLVKLESNKFAVLISDIAKSEELFVLVERLQETLGKALVFEGRSFILSACIGMVLPSQNSFTPEKLLRDGEKALNQAKRSRKKYCIISGNQQEQAVEKSAPSLLLDEVTYKALSQDQFQAHFQPIIDLRSGRVQKCEALLRSRAPLPFSPSEIITAAEKSGQITQIAYVTLQNACRFASALAEQGYSDIEVKVNISPYDLGQYQFCEILEKMLTKHAIQAWQIGLEITENIFIEKDKAIQDCLKQLKSLGISIALDDFGTGFSNLSALKMLPLSSVKIDQSFIRESVTSEKDAALVAAIIVLAHALDLEVIAEGVEKQEQLDFLTVMECDYAQGFLYSPALHPSDFLKWLSVRNSSSIQLPE